MGKLKPARIVDPGTVQWVRDRRDGACLYGLYKKQPCSSGLDTHHIQSKGTGGDDRPQNLITLCRIHHNQVHAGRIQGEELRAILSAYFGYT